MYLLYLDESGQHGGDYFVLGGAAVFERQTYWVAQELDKLQLKYLPDQPDPIEFHATDIRAGQKPPWDSLSRRDRYEILDSVYELICKSRLTLFGIAIQRDWLNSEKDEYSYAFESLTQQFDQFLRRKYSEDDDPQRGLIIIAESEYQRRIESVAQRIREEGTRWGELRNLAEIPLFTAAPNSRMLQVADFCSNAIYGRYAGGFTRQFDRIIGSFYQDNGVYYGLWHYCTDHNECSCPACLTRRLGPASPSPTPGTGGQAMA